MVKTVSPPKRKRRESFGAVRTLPSGRIQASYVGPDGERHNAPQTFDNKTDARGWLSIQQAKLHTGQWSPMDTGRADAAKSARAETLATYSAQWLSTRMNRHGEPLRPRTRSEYQRLLDTALVSLAGERLSALTPEMIRTWYALQAESGTRTQAARAYGFLKAVLATAVEDGKININPCMIRGAQNAVTGRTVEPPTPSELQKILDTITPRYRAAVIIAAWGGCRYGELTELRRRDIVVTMDGPRVDHVVVKVSRAVTSTTGEGFTVGKTKSEAGVRSIVLPPHVQQIVVDHLRDNVNRSPDALLYPASDGISHLAQSTFAKHWYPARKAAGRQDMPWHALRHYGATRAALAGATLKELQERLGHSTVAAAMRYQHTAGRDAELAQRMSDLAQA
ncbi:site-specific integrase [Cryobacterium sp. MDB1-18-2]|uniref:tyrosine-type recombinase/integrase n=1 Tax=unclassified Cryobacterium TaxID=2649013 RepID=UPI00106C626D|nr:MULTISPECIES: site-specific integrase [unclassified Cryobacterium]TFC26999.1 site-specific integrase [Cryobacterium sp. MDB1-18-2]TFC44191.1 site-specific integrase [Cryobacterium sp. MDB1-18-1]